MKMIVAMLRNNSLQKAYSNNYDNNDVNIS